MRQLIAEHLPRAKRGSRSAPLVIADVVSDGDVVAAAAEAGDDLGPRLPRPRPDLQTDIAMAASERVPEPILAAAAAPLPSEPDATQVVSAHNGAPEGDISEGADDPADLIAERIGTATAVAELAYAAPAAAAEEDPIARLTALAKARAGGGELIARGPAPGDADAGEAGWHIQIGAVPTMEGARALIENAQAIDGHGPGRGSPADAARAARRHHALPRAFRRLLRQGGGARRPARS